jgi:signal transduction histidine kinase
MPPDSGIVGMVAKTGQPIIANDPTQHPAWSPLPDQLTGFESKKILAVPLMTEGEILGVIELLNKIEGDFVQDDVQLLSLVASSAAIAIQNARQYSALKAAKLALEEAQEQRLAAERWAVLGKASANLAHRINNSTALVPLAAQHTRELVQSIENLPPELRQDIADNLDRIERNSLYTVELAAELLSRFRKNPAKEYNVNNLLERAIALVEIPPNIKLVRSLDSSLPDITISDMLVEAFVELISNAVRAISNQTGWLRIASFKVGNGQIVVQITDNGPGISAENIDRIFDIFFTSTPNSLGFGLWWVKAFLEQNQAEIVVDSKADEQTTFTVTLPRQPSPLRSSSN